MIHAHSMTTGTVALIAVLAAGCGSSNPTTPSGTNGSGGDNAAGGSSAGTSSTSGGAGSTNGGAGSTSGGASSTSGGASSASGGGSGTSNGGTSNGGVGNITGGSSSTGGLTGTGGAVPVCTAGTGKCNNATDCAIKKSDMEGWEPACAQSSLGAAGPTATCMKGHGLTQGCADCWGAVAACGAQNCLTPCLADSNSTACRDCTSQHCDAAFGTCAGI
jgi:hypothetical protein